MIDYSQRTFGKPSWLRVLVCVLTAFLLQLPPAVAREQEKCLDRGFNPQVLLCSTCEHVHKVLGQKEVYDDCRACCIEKQEEVYEKIVLQLDKRYLPFYKEIQDVIEQKESLRLKVKYRSGNPMLLMYLKKDDAEAADTIAVGSWKFDTFKEYLSTHLVSKSKQPAS